MAIDLKKMQGKLKALQNKGSKTSFWSPKEGQTYSIRLMPANDGDPFKERWFHYEIAKNGFLCPKKNFGDECPACDFAAKLYKDKTEESRKMAKIFTARQRFFSAIVVRGEEKEGVKVWGYGKNAYQDLINLVLNPDYGDITDTDQGTDLSLMASKANGQSFPTTKLTPARKTSALCKNTQECSELMESLPDFEELHKRTTTEEVSAILDEYLAGGTDSEEEVEEVSSEVKRGGANKRAKSADPVEDAFAELGLN